MLRTNLSTRPFYNERTAIVVLASIAVLLAILTALNVGALVTVSAEQRRLAAAAAEDEHRTAEWRQQAARLRAGVDQAQFTAVADAAHEANQIIARRTFSWTGLFNQFEATLPPDVRITSVTPNLGRDGRLRVDIGVVSRAVPDIDAFIEALEKTGAFQDVLAREERQTDEGAFEARLSSIYVPAGEAAAVDEEAGR